jgi:glycosyltransferase involved in cell wall biosynthesis
MKIILIISKFFPEYSGPSVRMLRLYDFLKKKHVNLEIICGGLEYQEEEYFKIKGFKVHRLANFENQKDFIIIRIIKNYLEFFKLWKILRKKKFDLLHIVGQTNLTTSAITYANINKIPMIIELVSTGSYPRRTLPILNKVWLPKLKELTVVIAISKFLKQKCLDQGLKDNIWYRPNPIDTKKFNIDLSYKNRNRKKISKFDKTDILICSVAKFMPQKNQIFLIEVLKNLSNKYKLILAGPKIKSGNLLVRDKNYLQKIKRLIIQYNLQNRVLLIEKFVDTEKYIKISDIYVLPAYNEGLGTPLLESVACGVPVVANSNEPAFKEWINKGENGYLVKLNEREWSSAIQKCTKIKNYKLKKSSEYIQKVASENLINENYYKIMKNLVNSDFNEINLKK